MIRKTFPFFYLFVLLGLFFSGTALAAEEWPPQKIEIIIPHGVGSSQDLTTRLVGKYWNKYMPDVMLVFINKEMSSGRLAYDQFQKAKRDGTTILSANMQSAAATYASQKPDWKWEDTIYLLDTYDLDMTIVQVRHDSPFTSFAEIIEKSKTEPITAGTARQGAADTLLLYQIKEMTGANFEVIPLGEGGGVRAALLGGHVDFTMRKASDLKVAGGQIRVLAVNTPDKNPIENLTGPVPSIDEVVGQQVLNANGYRALAVHPEVKKDYPERYQLLWETLDKIKNDPDFIEDAKRVGCELIVHTDPEEITRLVQNVITYDAKYARGERKSK